MAATLGGSVADLSETHSEKTFRGNSKIPFLKGNSTSDAQRSNMLSERALIVSHISIFSSERQPLKIPGSTSSRCFGKRTDCSASQPAKAS